MDRPKRTRASFEKFFDMIGKALSEQIEFVCSDRWKPYLQLIAKHCTQALNSLDRFHVVAKMNLALDEVHAAEARRLVQDGYEPVLKFARTIRAHRELLLNYFRARKAYSSGVIEGLNNKAKVTLRKAYGFRTFGAMEIALYLVLGKLPEPELTRRFY